MRNILASLEDEEETLPVVADDQSPVEETEQVNAEVDNQLAAADAVIDEQEQVEEQLTDAADELEDVQETLEAMRESLAAGQAIPAYASADLKKRVQRVYGRLDNRTEVPTFSGEADSFWLSDLNDSIESMKVRIDKQLAASCEGFLDVIAGAWKTMTDASYRVSQRSKELAAKVGALSESDMSSKAQVVESETSALQHLCVGKNGAFAFPADVAGAFKQKEALTEATIQKAFKASSDLVDKLKLTNKDILTEEAASKGQAVASSRLSVGKSSGANFYVAQLWANQFLGRNPETKIKSDREFQMLPETPYPGAQSLGFTLAAWDVLGRSEHLPFLSTVTVEKAEGKVDSANVTKFLSNKGNVQKALLVATSVLGAGGVMSKTNVNKLLSEVTKWRSKINVALNKVGTARSGLGSYATVVIGGMLVGIPIGNFFMENFPNAMMKNIYSVMGKIYSGWISAVKALNTVASKLV